MTNESRNNDYDYDDYDDKHYDVIIPATLGESKEGGSPKSPLHESDN